MKTAYIAILLTGVALAACDSGNKTPKTAEGWTATPSVAVNPGEKSDSASASGSSARAERGSGTTATTSAGTTTGDQPTSTGGTTR
jgi:hypothetical protein